HSGHLVYHPLRADPEASYALAPTPGALSRHEREGVAPVAQHPVYVGVVHQRNIAPLTHRHEATLPAQHEAVASAPVEIEDRLLSLRQRRIERRLQSPAEERAVPRLQLHA